MNGGEVELLVAQTEVVLLTQTQVGEMYGLDDYWLASLVKKGRIRKYKVLGKSRPYYSEPEIREVTEAMRTLGRLRDKLRAFFDLAA